MRRTNSGKPVDKRVFVCPQCDKQRMTRPMDHEVSHEKREYKTFSEETIELFFDICDWCILRNKRKHFEPSPQDIKRMLAAMKTEEDGPSIENLL